MIREVIFGGPTPRSTPLTIHDVIPVWADEENGVLESVIVDGVDMSPAEARRVLIDGEDCVIHGPMTDPETLEDRGTFNTACPGCLWAALIADPGCAG